MFRLDALMCPELQQTGIAGHDHIRTGGDGAFENAVVYVRSYETAVQSGNRLRGGECVKLRALMI